jgi:hypothetical protein
MSIEVSCGCGASRLLIHSEGRARLLCHCSICQRFNDAPFADVVIFRREEAVLADASTVDFQRYKSTMAVDRGKCRACAQPFIEYLKLPLVPAMAFVPAAVLGDAITLPPPALRLFYDKRVADVDDELPRYSGFLSSQVAATRLLLPALR